MKVKVDSFLKAEDLKGATKAAPITATILDLKFIEAEELPFPSEVGRYEMKVTLPDNTDVFNWMLNKTSLKVIKAAYGEESNDWIDKEIKLYSLTQNVGGKEKEVIYAVV